MDQELSIVVPCYNEARNLERLIGAFRHAIGAQLNIELLLVDNGSRDETPQVMAELLRRPENRFARSVRVEVNQGYGYGIMFGLSRATGRILAWTHADLQTPPDDVLRALKVMQSHPNPNRVLVQGKRQGRPLFDRAFSAAMGWFASIALRCPMSEINAQPKMFHRSVLEHFSSPPNDFTLDLYLLYVANQLGMETVSLPVQFGNRSAGQAKGGGTLLGKAKLTKRTIQQILKLRSSLKQSVKAQHVCTRGCPIGDISKAA